VGREAFVDPAAAADDLVAVVLGDRHGHRRHVVDLMRADDPAVGAGGHRLSALASPVGKVIDPHVRLVDPTQTGAGGAGLLAPLATGGLGRPTGGTVDPGPVIG